MTTKKFKLYATIFFYLIGMVSVGLFFISWNQDDVPPAAEPLNEVIKSISDQENAIPLPINDREPQNFAQPTSNFGSKG